MTDFLAAHYFPARERTVLTKNGSTLRLRFPDVWIAHPKISPLYARVFYREPSRENLDLWTPVLPVCWGDTALAVAGGRMSPADAFWSTRDTPQAWRTYAANHLKIKDRVWVTLRRTLNNMGVSL